MRHYDDFKYPDASEKPIPGYSDDVLVWFEGLDAQLASAISFLLRRGDNVGQIVTAALSFKAKVDLLAALFRHERPASEHLDQLDELCGAWFQIEQKRNQVVHSKWGGVLEGMGMTRSKYTARHKHGLQHHWETLTPMQVEAIGMHCGYLAHEVDELMYLEFGRDYGEP